MFGSRDSDRDSKITSRYGDTLLGQPLGRYITSLFLSSHKGILDWDMLVF